MKAPIRGRAIGRIEDRLFRARHGTEAFSLLEILIVISIVSTLAALLMPAFKGAKDSALSVQCVNNLRQIGLAMAMYGNDHGTYPWGYDPIYQNTCWSYKVSPYLQKLQGDTFLAGAGSRSPLLQCPSRAIKTATNVVCTYGVHDRIFGNSSSMGAPTYPRRYPFDERSQEVMLAADAGQDSSNVGGDSQATIWNYHPAIAQAYNPSTAENLLGPGSDSDSVLGQIRWRHGGRANFLFADSHVQSIDRNAFYEKYLKITGP